MAKRPTAFKSQLGSQLGSLLSRTWHQLEGVREVVAQKTKAGRVQLDLTLLRRKRKDALAELGEVVARLARSGRIDEDDFPELSSPLTSVQEIDERIEREETRARRASAGLEDDGYAAEDDDREEYDEDDDGEPVRGARGEFDEDGERARAAAGRRLRGEDDYGAAADVVADDDDDDDDLDDDDDDVGRRAVDDEDDDV